MRHNSDNQKKEDNKTSPSPNIAEENKNTVHNKKTKSTKNKSNLIWGIVTAAICIVVAASIIISSAMVIKKHRENQAEPSSIYDHYVPTNDYRSADNESSLLVEELNNFKLDDESRKAIKQYSDAENRIQTLFKEYDKEKNTKKRYDELERIENEINLGCADQQIAINKLIENKGNLPEVLIIDVRKEWSNDIRVAVLNLSGKNIKVGKKLVIGVDGKAINIDPLCASGNYDILEFTSGRVWYYSFNLDMANNDALREALGDNDMVWLNAILEIEIDNKTIQVPSILLYRNKWIYKSYLELEILKRYDAKAFNSENEK